MVMLMSVNREQLIKQMTEYVIEVLEEKRPEFSGLAVCPFVKADRITDQLYLDVFDNTKETLLDVLLRFIRTGKKSALIAQPNCDVKKEETKGYQEFINLVLEESGNGNLLSLCFNPNDELEVDGYNPRSRAPCFLINLAYKRHLSKSHRSLRETKYYDNLPPTYKKFLNVK